MFKSIQFFTGKLKKAYHRTCCYFGLHEFTTAFLERDSKLHPKIIEHATTEEDLLTSETIFEIMKEDNSIYCKHCKKKFTYVGSTFRNYKK